jgi:hypothetical protein
MLCVDSVTCDTKGWDVFVNDVEKQFRIYFGKFYYNADKTFDRHLPDLTLLKDIGAKYHNKL